MPRTGVTYFDISKAAETILERGDTPTVDKVRSQLGTGSKSTIAPLLKRWRTDSGVITEPQSGLPSDLLEAVKSLFDRVHSDADKQIKSIEQGFDSRQSKYETLLAEANKKIKQLSEDKTNLLQETEQLKTENTNYRLEIESLLLKLTKSEIKLEDTSTQLGELKTTIKELKQENRDVRDHLHHYQQ